MKKRVVQLFLVVVFTGALFVLALKQNKEQEEIKVETVTVKMEETVGDSIETELKLLKKSETHTVICNEKEIKKKQKEEQVASIYDCYTESEIMLMWRVIETEAYQAGFDAKCNVASVILNRLEYEDFPDNVTAVITTPNQFAYGRNEITEETKLALEYAFQIEDTTNGAIAFHSNAKTNTFCGYDYLFTDEAGHHFYGEKE